MPLPAARFQDQHTCPVVIPAKPGKKPVPHVGGPILSASPKVFINGRDAARVKDVAACMGTGDETRIATGSPNVLIGGLMAARLTDLTVHGGLITTASPLVWIGGPAAEVTVAPDGTLIVKWGGLTIEGTKGDVAAFLGMLALDAGSTQAGRNNLMSIINDTTHPVTCKLGRGFPSVTGDNFGTNIVDLDDLQKFPSEPSPGHPEESTREEEITHFLAERHHAAVTGDPIGPSHDEGIRAQNEVRKERGQDPVIAQNETDSPGHVDIDVQIQKDPSAPVQHEHIDVGPNPEDSGKKKVTITPP
jgi:uncharacterized Zn-binding protein involved in type VI secretion